MAGGARLRFGADLAQAVAEELGRAPEPRVILLKNHGVVIGGSDVEEVHCLLELVNARLATTPQLVAARKVRPEPMLDLCGRTYQAVESEDVQSLAFPALFSRLRSEWALYPDHVVFLGPEPLCYDSVQQLRDELDGGGGPEFFFLKGEGVFAAPGFSEAQKAQLQCYHDILVRQPEGAVLRVLDAQEIAELLNWDAERYRLNVANVQR